MSTITFDVDTDKFSVTTDTPPSDFQHYFKKEDLDRNLLDGSAITAVCGFVKEGLARPENGQPVCAPCKWLYDHMMQPGDDE